MKRILKQLLVAALLLSCGSVSAAPTSRVHQEVIGEWCQPLTRGHVTSYWERQEDQNCGEEILIVEAHRYAGWEFACRITAVKTWVDPTIILNTKEWGTKVSQIDSICSDVQVCEWRERITLHVSKGTLSLRGIWRSKEKCKSA
jgi:hypothetical protein